MKLTRTQAVIFAQQVMAIIDQKVKKPLHPSTRIKVQRLMKESDTLLAQKKAIEARINKKYSEINSALPKRVYNAGDTIATVEQRMARDGYPTLSNVTDITQTLALFGGFADAKKFTQAILAEVRLKYPKTK